MSSFFFYRVVDIDIKLGFFQKFMKLTGDEVRAVFVKYPRLISFKEFRMKVRLCQN